MKSTILTRLSSLEQYRSDVTRGACFRFGYVTDLPADFEGERNVVVTTRVPMGGGIEWCEFEERQGPEPIASDEFGLRAGKQKQIPIRKECRLAILNLLFRLGCRSNRSEFSMALSSRNAWSVQPSSPLVPSLRMAGWPATRDGMDGATQQYLLWPSKSASVFGKRKGTVTVAELEGEHLE